MEEILLKSYRQVIDDLDGDGKEEIVSIQFQKMVAMKDREIAWESVFAGVPLVVKAYDIDGDGVKEIIVGGSERKIFIFKPNGEKVKEIQYWSPGDKRAGWIWDIEIDDVNNDGKPEILVGGMAAWGGEGIDVKLYDSEFNEIWKHHVDRSAFRLQIADVNGDELKEVVITTMNGVIRVLKSDGKVISKTQVGAGISALEVNDINNNGKKEIIVGTVDGDLVVFDHKLREKWKSKVSSYFPVQVYVIVADDFNDDGKKELLVACRRCLILFDANGSVIYKDDKNVLSGDIDGDGSAESIKMMAEKLLAYRGQEKIWELKMIDRLESVAVDDVNEDGKSEIVVCMSDGLISILDGSGKVVKEWKVDEQLSVVSVGDYNNDGKKEIIVGTANGNVITFTKEGEVMDSFKLNGEIGAISVFDINRDGKYELIISTKNQAGEMKLIKS